jgi:drug/metabolite transporter (DMT)-like permease
VVIAIALALGASLVYGLSDFLGGLKSRSLPQLSVLLVSQGGALAVLITVVAVLGADPPSARFLLYGVLAGLAEAVGIAALYRGLAVGTMSIVAPVAATAPVVPVVAGIALGELPTPIQGAGIALAIAGVTMLSLVPPGRRATSGRGASVLFGLLTALGFGGFLAAVDAASEGGVAWALLVARIVTVGAFAAVALIGRPNLRIRPAELPVLVGIGTLILVADAMYAVASTKGLLTVVAVLSSLYPVVTIALAHRYLDERIERLQPLGIAVALGGAAAISAAAA